MLRLAILTTVIIAILGQAPAEARQESSQGCYGTCVSHKQKQQAQKAIIFVFGEHSQDALRVARCESGYSTRAYNGSHLGLFQMGSSERRIYGHGSSAWEQAIAAHRYFVASGKDWSPWRASRYCWG